MMMMMMMMMNTRRKGTDAGTSVGGGGEEGLEAGRAQLEENEASMGRIEIMKSQSTL